MLRLSALLLLLLPLTIPAQETYIEYLSGTDKDHQVDWDFYINNGMNSGKWSTIPVPSNWELEGFGVYSYGLNWPKDTPQTREEGIYRHTFDVPKSWRGKHINIVFEGVMTEAEVTINGKSAGAIHQGSFYRFKYDITRLLRYGRSNKLEVKVRNWSENMSVNSAERYADYWIFGGIFRPVYLEVLPTAHIEWTAIDAGHTGSFELLAHGQHLWEADQLVAQVQTLDGENVGPALTSERNESDTTISVAGQMNGILPWSTEFPNRYQVIVQLKKGNQILHQVKEKFGFRTVELRERDGLYVNGAKVMLKGTNRHSFWPESGRCLSPEISVMDVNLVKDMNNNAIRMSHYPPDEHFLDVCDSLGLFVLDELAGWQTMYDSVVGKKLVKEMVIRDVNHPSVIIWDNGNEGGSNYAVDKEFHRYDPQQRLVIHPWKKQKLTDTQHYKDYDCCVEGLFQGNKVFFPTEFLHGLYDGGHGAGLEDHWTRMRQNPLSAGGFLWSLVDEAVVRRDKNDSLDSEGSRAPDGIVGPYREKEASFYTIKEIWSPVYMRDVFLDENWKGALPVENRFHYTNLSQCTFKWTWGSFSEPGEQGTDLISRQSGTMSGPNLIPGDAGTLSIPLPGNWEGVQALRIESTDPHGRHILTRTWPVKRPVDLTPTLLPDVSGPSGSHSTTGSLHQFGFDNGSLRIDTTTGMLMDWTISGKSFSLSNGPLPTFEPAPLEQIEVQSTTAGWVVKARSEASRKIGYVNWSWTIRRDGWIGLNINYWPKQGQYDNIGFSFTYPEEKVESVRYLGKGPFRVYKNRLRGGNIGVWQKDYNNTVTGQDWDYPEFKGFHANLYWGELKTQEGTLTVLSETENLFWHLFTPDRPIKAYNENTDGIYPETGNFSFLNAITPIGTKFKDASKLGPASQKNSIYYSRLSMPPLSIKVWMKLETQ